PILRFRLKAAVQLAQATYAGRPPVTRRGIMTMADRRKDPGAVIPRRPAPTAYRGLVCKARSALTPAGQRPPLSPFALLRQFVNLAFDRFEVERGGLLHRRKIYRRLRQRGDFLLHLDETPELTSKEAIHITRGRVVPRLTTQ